MNILYRDHVWFLCNQKYSYYVQAKEPLASKLRSLVGHTMCGVLQLYRRGKEPGVYEC